MAQPQAFITLDLPPINGNYKVGISVGVDPSLNDDCKLPVLTVAGVTKAQQAANAACWAYKKYEALPTKIRQFYCCAAYGIIDANLYGTVGTSRKKDGDWIETVHATMLDAADLLVLNSWVNLDNVRSALTGVLTTKANFWQTNHHTGQGQISGYPKKFVLITFEPAQTQHATDMLHTVGHWASTLRILNLAEIQGIRHVDNPDGDATLTLSDDAKLRFNSYPAGTHRAVLAYELAKKLKSSNIAKICPGVTDFMAIPEVYRPKQGSAPRGSFVPDRPSQGKLQ